MVRRGRTAPRWRLADLSLEDRIARGRSARRERHPGRVTPAGSPRRAAPDPVTLLQDQAATRVPNWSRSGTGGCSSRRAPSTGAGRSSWRPTWLRRPSLLPGWTRAHVLAHLARSADAMRTLLVGARSGQDRPAYASAEDRAAGIERSAAQTAKDLVTDVADSAMALRTVARQLPGQAWPRAVRILGSAPFPAAQLLSRRLVEVELHHCDLAAGYSPADWPAAFAFMELAEPMRSQREDRRRP